MEKPKDSADCAWGLGERGHLAWSHCWLSLNRKPLSLPCKLRKERTWGSEDKRLLIQAKMDVCSHLTSNFSETYSHSDMS